MEAWRESGDTESGDAEAIYDRYLDASLTGQPEDPASFFARHPGLDTHGREQIEALHGVLTGAEQDPDAEPQPPFERIGGYRLLRTIGHGAMGNIYLAEQESLSRLVALKLLRPELSASRSALQRFQREAKVIARLSHPNVVKVHELGEDRGVQFIAMELVPGRTLQSIFPRGRPALERTLSWMEQCARALQAAHDEGIVHRDVKPANILITPDDRPVLLDFGMAHLTGADGTRLTQTFAGSPSYAAPEQIDSQGRIVDGRTDVYGLGATLYECLTLQLPFAGGTLEEIFQKILRNEPAPPRKFHPGLPRDVETVTLKAMAKQPKNRYQSAREFAEDLRALRERRRIQAKPPGLVPRTRRWARRNPARATAIVSIAFAAALMLGALAWKAHADRQARREQATILLARARDRVTAYREHRQRHAALTARLTYLSERVEDSYLDEERANELDEVSVAVEKLRQDRQVLFHETLGLLRDAERLDPKLEGTDLVRAQFYIEMTNEAFEERNFIEAKFFSGLVRENDPTGQLTQFSRASGVLRLTVEPADAALYLFRDREIYEFGKTSERRFIPVPVGTPNDEPPAWLLRGEWALRVVAAHGILHAGDIIIEVNGHPIRRSVLLARAFRGIERGARLEGFPCIAAVEELEQDRDYAFRFGDREVVCKPAELPVASIESVAAAGGLPAKLFRNRAVLPITLPEGSELRMTATPLLPSDANRLAPSGEVEVEPGDYRILARAPGHVDTVLCLRANPGAQTHATLRLPPTGEGPPGFVYIPDSNGPYWMMEREVTCAEYRAFLQATGHTTKWPRDEAGAVCIPEDHEPNWPALGVSFLDAQAYARWRGAGYALPTRHQWHTAAQGPTMRSFVFGNVWRANWAKSCYSRPRALPEPVLRYPVDESIYRVYDMTGGVAEWLDDWFDKGRGLRRLAGSSWGFADPELFRIWGGNGAKPETHSDTFGFRLVWTAPE